MKPTAQQIQAGQAVYSGKTLSVYDLAVLGISNRFIWKCPTGHLRHLYHQHLSNNHLDVGVGTGYFLDRCKFPTGSPRVALMDLNPATLQFASDRIARFTPETYRQNILEPITADIEKFDSVGIN
ncbi:MAG: class I SAM-dependent methyltransferase, partial [Pirellulales bacterium]|nr:class I SAM-dependent methyltransferase [Pirellulales bacterium]